MDAPAMFTRKQVPEDVGLRNIAEDESAAGGQGQLHRDEKQHKPVLKKVKEKVKKIKHTLAGHSHGHDHGDEHGRDDRADDDDGSEEEEEGDASLEREAALEKGGYMEDVEDKPIAMESDPEVHGAPMYESARAPAVQDLVAKYDPARAPVAQDLRGADAPRMRHGDLGSPFVQDPAAQEVRGADAPRMRHGDLGAPFVQDPASQQVRGAEAPRMRHGDLGGPFVHDPAAQDMQRDDAPKVRFGDLGGPGIADPAFQEVRRDDAPKVRLGDLGGPVVEDPAAPRSTTPAAREGEDIGTTPVVQEFESMTLSDDPAHVGAAKKGARAEEWKDAAADTMGGASGGATYTDKLKNAAAVPAEYGKKLASTVYEKVAGVGTAVGAGKRDDERTETMPVSDAGREEWEDAPASTEATECSSGPGYTDKIKSAAAGTTEYGKQLASTVYEKVAGVGTAVAPSLRPQAGEDKPDDARSEATPMSAIGAEERKETVATDATDNTSGAGYTDKIKSAAAGTTEYGKQLASTVYEKVAGVGTAVAPRAGEDKLDDARSEATPVSDIGAEERKETVATDATDNTSAPGYTDKIKSAAAGTTGYGKQLASTVYEKVTGVGTAVVGKVQQATQSTGTATPGVGAQQDTGAATVTPGASGPGNGQDKGVSVTGYISEKLRPGDEDRALSEAISGAVQRRKEEVGGTVGQRVPPPSQVITKAREAVTALTGGNRVSETVQPTTTGEDAKGGVAAEEPVILREETGGVKLNTNTM